ncbi:hypothetical protein HKCCE3408_17405 [Rhodobacterales bacterium HKCCE3408]|nr:hypothetical protein [Rhodobacterales bacterium HKCCE3408]
MVRPLRLLPALLLAGCVPLITTAPPPPAQPSGPSLPPLSQLPPAGYVRVSLVDGSPGLGLWCDLRDDCIEAARILCDNRQSIRGRFDIDPNAAGATEFFSRSEGAPHSLTVSCPVV